MSLVLVVSCGKDNRTHGEGAIQASDGAGGMGSSSGSDRVANTGGTDGNAGTSGGAATGGVGLDGGTNTDGGGVPPGIDARLDSGGGGTSGSNGDASGSPPPPACSKPYAPGLTNRNLTAAGTARTYWLFVPASYDGSTRIPLVFNLHGRLSNATQQISSSDLNTKGEREGFVVVSPECIGTAWNVDLDLSGADDVAFVNAMIDELEETLCIDTKRIYSTGYSAGGRMSSRLACEISDRIASVAPVGGIRYPQPCRANRPVAVITFHGTSDPVNPYEGGGEAYWGTGVEDATEGWATHNGCSTTPAISSVSGAVDKLQYEDCNAGVELILYRVNGGGHTWPGSPNPLSELQFGTTTQDISANDLMWEFFKAHPLP